MRNPDAAGEHTEPNAPVQGGQKALEARICRPMDGLDTHLYAQVPPMQICAL